MNIIDRNWGGIVFIISIIAIVIALTAEYFYNLLPCKMCLYQRYPYYFIIMIYPIFLLLKKHNNILLFILFEFSIIYGLFYSIWHVGIEKKFFKGPEGCSNSIEKLSTVEKLKEQIISQPIVDCSIITWQIFTFSAATINLILLLFIVFFNTIFIIRNYYEK